MSEMGELLVGPGAAEVVAPVDDLGHDDWRRDRGRGLGGSDASAIMGTNKYRDAFCVYVDKVCEQLPDEDETSRLGEAAAWGTRLEPVIAQVVADREGWNLIKPKYLYRSATVPYMKASLDYLIARDDAWPFSEVNFRSARIRHGESPNVLTGAELEEYWVSARWDTVFACPNELTFARAILDIKTCSSYVGKDWEDKNGVPKPSVYVHSQLHHYMMVTGLREAWAACLIGGQRLVVVRVPYDEEYAERLRAEEHALWLRVELKTPPEPNVNLSDTLAALERYTAEYGELPDSPRHPATKTLPARPGWSTTLA